LLTRATNSNKTALLLVLEQSATIWKYNNTIAAINSTAKQGDSVL